MKNNNPVIKEASEFLFTLFKEKLSSNHLYHNYKHTTETVKYCKELGETYNLTSRDYEVLLLAAWFHDAGYVKGEVDHELESARIAAVGKPYETQRYGR